jgi:hypothetical protein
VLGAQLDLFADRHVRIEGARRALAEGRAEDAFHQLMQLRRSYPDDAAIASELERIRALLMRLGQVDAMAPSERPEALVTLVRLADSCARPWLLRRAAIALREASGSTGLVEGKPASVLFLEAGDLHTAWAVAADAVRDSARPRFLAYLADVEHRLDQRSRARMRYRDALATDPYDVDWDALADDDVQALPDIARTEFELDDGVAWAAPVGVVMKVLPIGEPPPSEPPSIELPSVGCATREHAELERSRAFLRALLRAVRESGPATIDARRRMRSLAPQLLASYLEMR